MFKNKLLIQNVPNLFLVYCLKGWIFFFFFFTTNVLGWKPWYHLGIVVWCHMSLALKADLLLNRFYAILNYMQTWPLFNPFNHFHFSHGYCWTPWHSFPGSILVPLLCLLPISVTGILVHYVWDYTSSVLNYFSSCVLGLLCGGFPLSFYFLPLPAFIILLQSATSSSLLAFNTLTSALWSTAYCAFSGSLIVSSSVSRDLCTSIPLTKKPFLIISYKSSIPYSYLLYNYYDLVDFISVFISVSHHENISLMRVSTRILFTIVVQTPKRISFKKKKK